LFSALTAWPEPRAPVGKIALPIASSTGRAFLSTFGSPPTIRARVPSFALALAPDTGESSIATPRLASTLPSSRVVSGSEELMSITIAPRARPGRAAMTAWRTARPSGTMVIRISAPAAASAGERQLPLPLRS